MPDLSPLETAEILRRIRCRYAAADVVRSYRYARPEQMASAEAMMVGALHGLRCFRARSGWQNAPIPTSRALSLPPSDCLGFLDAEYGEGWSDAGDPA